MGLRCEAGACVKKMNMLVDNFSGTMFGPGFGERTFGPTPYGTAKLINGQVHLTNVANTKGGIGLQSTEVFDLEDSSITVELVNNGAESAARETYLELATANNSNLVLFLTDGKLGAQYYINGSPDRPSVDDGGIPVTGTGPQKWRIRAAQNNQGEQIVSFDVFLAATWRQLGEIRKPLRTPLQNMRVRLFSSCFDTMNCVSATSIFDNLNTP
jgi:hypothetical protein